MKHSRQQRNRKSLICIFLSLVLVLNPLVASASSATDNSAYTTLTTDEIIELILNKSYGITLLYLSSSEAAYNYWASNDELFALLESKDDAKQILSGKFISLTKEYELTKDNSIALKLMCLNVLLDQPVFSSTAGYQTRSVYGPPQTIGDTLVQWHLVSNDVRTFINNRVYLYYTTMDYPEEWYQIAEAQIAGSTTNAVQVGPRSVMYNCHTYAWYDRSRYAQHWINDPEPYTSDPHYYEVTKASSRVGDVVVYFSATNKPLHSAIITSVDVSSSMVVDIFCESKMGACGIYSHRIGDIPEGYRANGSANFTIYRFSGSHPYNGVSTYTDSGHTLYCAHCSSTKTENHAITTTSYNSSTHTRSCSVCGWSKTEAHTFVNGSSFCKYCRYTKPGGLNAIVPEIEDTPE